MAEKKTFADRKYDKRIPYKPSAASKAMAEKYVAPAVLTGMSLIPIGGATGAMSRLLMRSTPKVAKGSQAGLRRFSAVDSANKVTKMKGRDGLARKPAPKKPDEPKVVDSGRSKALEKTRQGDGGPTKMKDRRGLDIRPEPPKGMSMAKKAAIAGAATGAITGGYYASKALMEARKGVAQDRKAPGDSVRGTDKAKAGVASDRFKPLSNADVQKSYQEVNRKHGTQRPVTEVQRAVSPDPNRIKGRPEDFAEIVKKTRKDEPKKAAKKVAKKPEKKAEKIRFSGNWKNAAPSEMQKRMGRRIKRKGLFS